jgi:arylsulfate sulfotransferase
MKTLNCLCFCTLALFLGLCAPAFGAVAIVSFTPSHKSPEPIGKTITWTATATDSATGPLTFQFNITTPNGQTTLVKDFNVGTLSGGTWTAQPFVWVPTGIEGPYQIQVVIKDFTTGETTSKTVPFTIDPVVTGSTPIIVKTANPLVVLFSAPSCAAGSTMRAVFQEVTSNPPAATVTNWVGCHPPASVTFEIAGMLPSTPYSLYAQTKTGSKLTNGSSVSFKTGALPDTVPFPTFTVKIPKTGAPTDTSNPVLLHNLLQLGGGTTYPDVATDLSGNIIWYYYADDLTNGDVMTRPLPGGGLLTMQDDVSWDPTVTKEQLLRQIDLAGNIVRETNMGVIQQQLTALGAVDGGSCRAFASPPPVGSACVGAFHHDAIQTLPNGWTAALLDIEKIFPAGTQGDTSGLPVDIIGDMIIVLDTNWQVQWYWDVFDPAHGGNGYNKLPVSRTAVLGETCGTSTSGCPPVFLLSAGAIAPLAHDWLHANTLYYWPKSGGSNNHAGDIVWSSRHQDWAMKIDYQDTQGSGDIIWRMGPSGDFTFQNAYNDPWPWFSHQHDVGIQNGGAGPMTLFDNGNTRVSQPSASTGGVPGLGSACSPNDCDSRGMAFAFDESAMTVSVSPNGVSLDLGSFSTAMGSADLLANGNYFFENPIVVINLNTTEGYSMEIGIPTPAVPQLGPANVILNLAGPEHYRGWQMPSLYSPPAT